MTQARNYEARFTYLLRPLRDLASTWGVDIASELENYLAELDKVRIGLEGAGPPLGVNFAEAAYLIQGSALIYSKKVEHLYALVYHAINVINNSQQKQKGSINISENTTSDTETDELFKEQEFLLLDDIIPQAAPEDIDLPRDITNGFDNVNITILEAPLSLLPQTSFGYEKSDHKESALGVSRAVLHHSGALLVDGMEYVETRENVSQPPLSAEERTNEDNNENIAGEGNIDGAYSDEDNFQSCDEDLQMTAEYLKEETRAIHDSKSQHLQQFPKTGTSFKDPFRQHDPHNPSEATLKPFKRGRTTSRGKLRKATKKRRRSDQNVLQSFQLLFDRTFVVPPKWKGAKFVRCPGLQDRFKTINMTRRTAFKKLQEKYARSNTAGGSDKEDLYADADDFDDNDDALISDSKEYDQDAHDDSYNEPNYEDGLPQREPRLEGDYHDPSGFGWQGEATVQMMAERREQRCKEYLAQIARQWQQNVVQNNLVERVETWTRTILPMLEEEETHPPFDIREYGRSIVNDFERRRFSAQSRKLPMSQVLSASEKYEFCRKFLASLQLANAGLVRILPASKVGDPVLELACKLDTTLTVSDRGKHKVTFSEEINVGNGGRDTTINKENVPNFANRATPIKRSGRKRRRKSSIPLTPPSIKRKTQRLRLR